MRDSMQAVRSEVARSTQDHIGRWLLLAGTCLLCLETSGCARRIPEPSGSIIRAVVPVELAGPVGTSFASFTSPDAVQGIAVDAANVYAIGTASISRHEKRSGQLRERWLGPAPGDAIPGPEVSHLNSGVVYDGALYTANSNWPRLPVRNSVEVFDTVTLRRLRSIPVSGAGGALTWVDRYADEWWGTLANYDRSGADRTMEPGGTRDTRLVRFDEQFRVRQRWFFPDALVLRLSPMSNSGGAWGADGRLYLTGHDRAEVYVVRVPETGGTLDWVETLTLPGVEGQGIAWDRSGRRPVLYGIARSSRSVIAIAFSAID